MKRAALKFKPSNCKILRDSKNYLGEIVDKDGLRPDPDAAKAALTRKTPKIDTQLMRFLRFTKYYREFLRGTQTKFTQCGS